MGEATAAPDPPFLYLTTTGRRTGNPHTIEIWFARDGAAAPIYLMAGGGDRSDWVRNLMASPAATVQIGSRQADAAPVEARVVRPDTNEDAIARRLMLAKYQAPGKNDLDEWGRTALPIALESPV